MPIVERLNQTVILKSSIKLKYNGTLNEFKIEFGWGKDADGEDNELLSIAFMNGHSEVPDNFIQYLDYVNLSRYDGKSEYGIKSWLKTNFAYVWHKDSISVNSNIRCDKNPTMDKFQQWIEDDGGTLKDIW